MNTAQAQVGDDQAVDELAETHTADEAADAVTKSAGEIAGTPGDGVDSLRLQLAIRDEQLATATAQLAKLERDRTVDEALIARGVLDLAMALEVIHTTMEQDASLDVSKAVKKLAADQPHLFRAVQKTGAMSARIDPAIAAPNGLSRTAETARETGKRTDLLSYLRLRRKK